MAERIREGRAKYRPGTWNTRVSPTEELGIYRGLPESARERLVLGDPGTGLPVGTPGPRRRRNGPESIDIPLSSQHHQRLQFPRLAATVGRRESAGPRWGRA